MCHGLRDNPLASGSKSSKPWQPAASMAALHKRAALLSEIRSFFAKRQVLEVETPLLSQTTAPDPHIQSISATVDKQTYYLQTSPEFAMKRLLSAGSGAIYQICKAFRLDEKGHLHNPEFTMLEWYRLGFDHHALMDEVDVLLQALFQCGPAERISYGEVFKRFLRVDPHSADVKTLKACAKTFDGQQSAPSFEGELDRDGWLDFLMSHCITTHLGQTAPVFIYDYPASQAALARIRKGTPPLASRFEVYYRGIEIGNGFHELKAPDEQRRRFEKNLEYRRDHQLPAVPLDEHLLAALAHGLPDCAGIAMGVDRMLMLALGYKSLEDVISFDFSRT